MVLRGWGQKFRRGNPDKITMTDQETEFKRAVRADNYAEYNLRDDLVIVTDWEGDGEFYPYVVIEGDYSEQEVDDILCEDQDLFTCEGIEIEEGQNIDFAHIYGVEFLHWAE